MLHDLELNKTSLPSSLDRMVRCILLTSNQIGIIIMIKSLSLNIFTNHMFL